MYTPLSPQPLRSIQPVYKVITRLSPLFTERLIVKSHLHGIENKLLFLEHVKPDKTAGDLQRFENVDGDWRLIFEEKIK